MTNKESTTRIRDPVYKLLLRFALLMKWLVETRTLLSRVNPRAQHHRKSTSFQCYYNVSHALVHHYHLPQGSCSSTAWGGTQTVLSVKSLQIIPMWKWGSNMAAQTWPEERWQATLTWKGKTQEASNLHKELQATKEHWEQEKVSSPNGHTWKHTYTYQPKP